MKAVYCPYCGGRAKRNGRSSSGSQRWRYTDCGASMAVRCDDTAAGLGECVSSRGFEQKDHRKLSSLSIGSAHAF